MVSSNYSVLLANCPNSAIDVVIRARVDCWKSWSRSCISTMIRWRVNVVSWIWCTVVMRAVIWMVLPACSCAIYPRLVSMVSPSAINWSLSCWFCSSMRSMRIFCVVRWCDSFVCCESMVDCEVWSLSWWFVKAASLELKDVTLWMVDSGETRVKFCSRAVRCLVRS